MPSAQDIIHKLEEGAGAKVIKVALIVMAVVSLFIVFNWRAYRNMNSMEAMDAAQVAHNLSKGEGFSTLFIRPFSIYLITNHNSARTIISPVTGTSDPAMLKQPHPDLANPPLYPLVLAGLMKVMPFNWEIHSLKTIGKKSEFSFWDRDGKFWWYQPDFLIAIFNQALLLLLVYLTYSMAKRLFDDKIALLSGLLVLGAELLWRFSSSGLPTLMLMVVFLLLARCLLELEIGIRENTITRKREIILSVAIGLLLGLGMMTRYSFAWLMFPTTAFLMLLTGKNRFSNTVVALAVFFVICAPWIARNFSICGQPFGTASYSFMETTPAFPGNKLQRSLSPEFGKFEMQMFWRKTITNLRTIVGTELPRLGGSWISAFFLVSLLLPFRNQGINRLKYFTLASLLILVIVSAVGRTQISGEGNELSGENLLVLFTPLLLIFGTALYKVLRDQIEFPAPEMRSIADGVYVVVACLPLLLALLPPRITAVAYPPYYPPLIQRVSNWMRQSELMMTDIPWAVAWVGNRQAIWLTLDSTDQFLAVGDNFKDVRALYITPRTTDQRFLTGWIQSFERPWGGMVLEVCLHREVPTGFPLRQAPEGFPLPDQLFLSDRVRWRGTDTGSPD